LTVKHIRAIQVDSGRIHIFNHIIFDLAVIVEHRQAVSHVLLYSLVFFGVFVHLCLNFIDFRLNVVEGPLLRFLHLDHHFLDLFELLEGVGLHLLKGLLL